MVPICTRTGQVIEPMLTDQWFVAMSKVGEGDATGLNRGTMTTDAVSVQHRTNRICRTGTIGISLNGLGLRGRVRCDDR